MRATQDTHPPDRRSLLSGAGLWPRHSDYEAIATKRSVYIVPKKGSGLEFYRPFDHYPQLLLDFLKTTSALGSMMEDPFAYHSAPVHVLGAARKSRLMQKAEEAVLPFVRQYGLFGLFSHFIDYEVWSSEHKDMVFSLSPDWWGSDRMTYSEYAPRFYPRGITPVYSPNPFTEEALEDQGESVEMILSSVSRLHRQYRDWNTFNTSREEFDLEEYWDERHQITWEAHLEQITVPTQLGVVFRNGKPQMDWRFKSLLEAVWIMFVENVTKADRPIRLCPACNMPFVPVYPTQTGCTRTHSERIKKQRQRERGR